SPYTYAKALARTRLYTLSLHDALPIWRRAVLEKRFGQVEFRQATDPAGAASRLKRYFAGDLEALTPIGVDPGGTAFQRKVWSALDRKSTRLNSSHVAISYAVFCLKKKI